MEDPILAVFMMAAGALFSGLIVFASYEASITQWPDRGFVEIGGVVYRLEAVDLSKPQ